jgi:uncharacterized protein (DUF2249 family)
MHTGDNTVVLDIREEIRQGREPFSKIMQAAASLQAAQQLLLLAPFEPLPLFAVMAKRGFYHVARPLGGGDWEVRFMRQTAEPTPADPPGEACSSLRQEAQNFSGQISSRPNQSPLTSAATGSNAGGFIEVDARGLEPPQPMIKILEALSRLPAGATLRARTDRRPMHLYAQLAERGFRAETEEQSDGSFITNVHCV